MALGPVCLRCMQLSPYRLPLTIKKHCAGVFIDLKKAFDTVNHDLLVKKLFFYGIRGTANAWLNNSLTNRNQYVIADDH